MQARSGNHPSMIDVIISRRQFLIVKNATFKIYKGAPHGMCTTHKDQVNQDLLAFFQF